MNVARVIDEYHLEDLWGDGGDTSCDMGRAVFRADGDFHGRHTDHKSGTLGLLQQNAAHKEYRDRTYPRRRLVGFEASDSDATPICSD